MKISRYFCMFLAVASNAAAQSADWQHVIWRDPQVRHLLADMTLNGGKTDLYRKYAAEERDPDSREAIRLWDAGVRAANPGDFERRWLENAAGKDGKVLRIVQRGTKRTIMGHEVVLTHDGAFSQAARDRWHAHSPPRGSFCARSPIGS